MTAPPTPKSPLPTLLTLSVLLIPYTLLTTQLGLSPNPLTLPTPLPSLLLILATFFALHLALPHLVTLYAPDTAKGRYGAEWTAFNLNWFASCALGLGVLWTVEPTWAEGLRVGWLCGWSIIVVVGLAAGNIMYSDTSDNPWNEPKLEQERILVEAKLEKLKAELELVRTAAKEGRQVVFADLSSDGKGKEARGERSGGGQWFS